MIGYPDNETDGGNKRGFYAVDFQMQRGEPDQVASGQSSAIIGGICNRASGLCSVAIGGGNYSATTYTNAATNTGAIVIGGMSNTASGRSTCGLNALVSDAAEHYSMIIGGRYVKTASQYSIATGFSSGPETSTANRTFEIQPNGGDVYASGSITGSQTFTDYAEYFENLSTGEIPLGTIVTRVGRKVRPAQTGDRILGVVSGTAGVCLGDSPFTWQGRYLTGEFGQPLWETIPDPAWDEKILDMDWTPGQGQTEADRPQIDNPEPQPNINVRKQNPDYDPGCEQVPRSERPDEWTCVGLVGQVHVRIDATVTTETEFIAPSSGGGIGTASAGETRLELMEIRAEYDPDKGYGVGLCLVR